MPWLTDVWCTTLKLGFSDSPQISGMTGPLFLKVLERVKKHTRTSKEDHVILTVDSHESHFTLASILYARENSITLVTFLPHHSHWLQPLYVGVMEPCKRKFCVAQHDWTTTNPGKVIKIHDLESLTNAAYQASFSAKNITAVLLSLVYGHSHNLSSVKRILSRHLLYLWKKSFLTKKSLFLLLAPV